MYCKVSVGFGNLSKGEDLDFQSVEKALHEAGVKNTWMAGNGVCFRSEDVNLSEVGIRRLLTHLVDEEHPEISVSQWW